MTKTLTPPTAVVPEPPLAKPREIAFDVLKGIGIAEVFAHHTLNWSARKFYEVQSPEWWGHMVFNRLLHFAIPTFLLASAILLARSLSKHERPNYGLYAKRRFTLTVWPYLVWTVLYLCLRVSLFDPYAAGDVHTWSLPWGDFSGPSALMDPSRLAVFFFVGKAHFHLYFMSVLIQLSIALPFVLIALRKVRLNFGQTVLAAAGLQVALLFVHALLIRSPYPGSLIISYVPSLLIGVWLGMNWKEWPEVWGRNKRWFIALAAAATVPYLWLSMRALVQAPIPPYILSISTSVFATATGLSLLGYAGTLNPAHRAVRFFSALGNLSLPLFLIHPILMYFMGGPRAMAVLDALPFTPVAAYLILLAGTWLVIQAIIGVRLDRLFFGRHFKDKSTAA